MKLTFNVTGAERKSLVAAISTTLNSPTKYLGAPTFAYEVGGYHIDKTGTVVGADDEELVGKLEVQGFTGEVEYDDGTEESESLTYQAELSDPECPDRMEVFSAENDADALRQAYEFCEGEVLLLELKQLDEDYNFIRGVEITPRTDRLTIEIPLKGFTPEKLDNLAKLVNAKASLLKAALGTDNLPIRQTADTLQFPWFSGEDAIDADHADAYATLVGLLCKSAREKKRVIAKEKDVDGSPKYAMRCFLLSLGMIGDEYKKARKILLSRLEGNSSCKTARARGCRQMANFPTKAVVDARKSRFPKGARVELVSMSDPYTTLKPGDRGTVDCVDDTGTVFIIWDNGSTLGAVYGADEIRLQPNSMSDRIKEQILAIRATGKTNMFDTNAVQRLAFDSGFYELVDFIETNSKSYSVFILTGLEE